MLPKRSKIVIDVTEENPLAVSSMDDTKENAEVRIWLMPKEKTQPIVDSIPSTDKPKKPLIYITQCNEEKIKKLEETYNTTRETLDKKIDEHRYTYYSLRIMNGLAKLSNLLFTYTLMATGNLAIDACYKAIMSQPLDIGNYGYLATVPLGLCDLALFTLIFSSEEDAIELTLSLSKKQLRERVTEKMAEIKKSPLSVVKELSHIAILLISYTTMGMPRIIALNTLLNRVSRNVKLPLLVSTQIIGMWFANKYFTRDYYKNLDNLRKEIKEGTFLNDLDWHTRFQIAAEYICSVGAMVYPVNYWQTLDGQKIYGRFFPTALTSIVIGWQLTISTLYNITEVYTKCDYLIIDLLKTKYGHLIKTILAGESIAHLKKSQFGINAITYLKNVKELKNDEDPDKIVEKFVRIHKNTKLIPDKLKKQSHFQVITENPSSLVPLSLEFLFGIYASYQIGGLLPIPRTIPTFILGVPLGIVLADSMYLTKENQQIKQKVFKDLSEEINIPKENKIINEEPRKIKESLFKGGMLGINFGALLIMGMYLLGSLNDLTKNFDPSIQKLLVAIFLYIVLKTACYNLTYNYPKVEATARNRFFPVIQKIEGTEKKNESESTLKITTKMASQH